MTAHRLKLPFVLIFLIVTAATSISFIGNGSREPRNLALCKEQVKAYVTSKRYMEDIREVTTEAQTYIAEHMRPANRNAIVLDIDETSLSNLEYDLELDFGYSLPTWNEWIKKSQAAPILPTLGLYRWTRSKNIAVFFITGTEEKLRAPLTTNLQEAGYTSWDSLYLRPNNNHDPASAYKGKVRKEITQRGYYIIASIGDQESDFAGGYAEKTFKLPNPMYIVK